MSGTTIWWVTETYWLWKNNNLNAAYLFTFVNYDHKILIKMTTGQLSMVEPGTNTIKLFTLVIYYCS
jgi:hypothetical protein